jgi:hypothetical protein
MPLKAHDRLCLLSLPILGATLLLLPLASPAATERLVRPDGDVDVIETDAGSPFTTFRRELRNAGPPNREVRMVEFVRPISLPGST